MNIFGTIVSAVGKVATTAAGVFKIAKPILEAFGAAMPEVEQALDKFDDLVKKGGEEADDFCDRNLHVIKAVEFASARGVVVMTKLNELATKVRIYSQEQTPNELTPAELEELGKLLYEFKEFSTGWVPEINSALKALETAK